MSERYDLVDLMTDVARFSEGRETVVHIVKAKRGGFCVIQDGRMADALSFDEMLGQVVNLLHPGLGRAHYRMLSREELLNEMARFSEAGKYRGGSE